MKPRFWLLWGIASLAALVAAGAGALRPLVLASLIDGPPLGDLVKGSVFAAAAPDIRPVLALLVLEVADAAASLTMGGALGAVSAGLGRLWRGRLARATLRSMAREPDQEVPRFSALAKTYVEVIELYHRLFLVQSITAAAQVLFTFAVTWMVSSLITGLLVLQFVLLVAATALYAPLQASLARARLAADERMLAGAELNPRKGVSVWFGGTGPWWLLARLIEVRAVARVRRRLSLAEASYLQLTTFAVGVFVVVGYVVIVDASGGSREQFVAYLLYAGLMTAPVVRLASFLPETREFLIARAGLANAIAAAPQPQSQPGLRPPLSFSMSRNGAPAAGIQTGLGLEPGERVALVGRSGAGKTTAILALLGYRDGDLAGNINGVPSSDLGLAVPHAGIRYLTETPAFEAGTVLENAWTTPARFAALSEAYGLFPSFTSKDFEDFLTRRITATGEPLSLGERQRLQLVRALASKPSVLILDEALSGVEEDREQAIVLKLIADRSISVIVHIGHRRSVQALFPRLVQLESALPPVAPAT